MGRGRFPVPFVFGDQRVVAGVVTGFVYQLFTVRSSPPNIELLQK